MTRISSGLPTEIPTLSSTGGASVPVPPVGVPPVSPLCRRCHEQPAILVEVCGNCADDLYQEWLADQCDPDVRS